jgi:DnaJ-class molecular chaperone
MVECPHCNGKRGQEAETMPEWIPSIKEWKECYTCEGKGEISNLHYAIYKARGGPRKITFRGYA